MALPQPRGQAQAVQQTDTGDRDPRRQAVAWLNSNNIKEQVERALPNHVPFEWFLRAAQTAILNKPELASADKASLLRELVAVAQLGLVLDPQLGEAWLIVDHKGKVQRRVGYQGLRKLALQSGKVTALNAQAVYENDHCEISLGDAPSVKHAIDIRAPDRGKVIGCYAVGKVDGTNEPVVEWMSWPEIDEHRKRYSDAYKHPDSKKRGPWGDPLSEIEMGRKTVFRRLCKWLPKSPLLADALAHEDRTDLMRDVTPGAAATAALPAPDESQYDDGEEEPRQQQAQQQPGRSIERTPERQRAAESEAAADDDGKPYWDVGGKRYVQPGRAATTWANMIEGCRTLEELEQYESGAEAQKIATLPPANRQAVEHAVMHQRSVLEAHSERPGIPQTNPGRPAEDHPMASVDHLEPEGFRQADEQQGGRPGQFNLLKE